MAENNGTTVTVTNGTSTVGNNITGGTATVLKTDDPKPDKTGAQNPKDTTQEPSIEELTLQLAKANAENAKALADPETGMAATMAKIMTTVARMCAGDKVPYADEKKLMEYDSDLYGKAKQAQMMMAAMKEKQKEYDSLWDEEGGEYDPEAAAENAEATGELLEIPETGTEAGTEASSDEAGL